MNKNDKIKYLTSIDSGCGTVESFAVKHEIGTIDASKIFQTLSDENLIVKEAISVSSIGDPKGGKTIYILTDEGNSLVDEDS